VSWLLGWVKRKTSADAYWCLRRLGFADFCMARAPPRSLPLHLSHPPPLSPSTSARLCVRGSHAPVDRQALPCLPEIRPQRRPRRIVSDLAAPESRSDVLRSRAPPGSRSMRRHCPRGNRQTAPAHGRGSSPRFLHPCRFVAPIPVPCRKSMHSPWETTCR
jgi:hypothetical protein